MHLEYNDVVFDLVSLEAIDRVLVLNPDRSTVLWVEWTIHANCVYTPRHMFTPPGGQPLNYGGTSLSPVQAGLSNANTLPTPDNPHYPGDGSPPPKSSENTTAGLSPPEQLVQQPGAADPIFTDREVLRRLGVPRKKLKIYAYPKESNGVVKPEVPPRKKIWLESPRGTLPSDCQHGPVVTATPVVAALGEANAFGVQLEIKTWVPPTPNDRLVLSHRWQTTHARSDSDFLIRRTRGEVIFHMGMLRANAVRPDFFLEQLLHPIPRGFQRHLGPITQSPDGSTLHYEFDDEDQTIVFSPGRSGAVYCDLKENFEYGIPTFAPEFLNNRLLG